MQLVGRQAEGKRLDQLLTAVRAGENTSLVIRGDAGSGKTALLRHLIDRAADCQVVSATAVQPERNFPYATLQRLCLPMMDRLVDLPEPQRDALSAAFGLHAGPSPSPFLTGMAMVGLVSGDKPLLFTIDDAQCLDQESASVLAFAARRASAGFAFTTRDREPRELSALPVMELAGLGYQNASVLLDSAVVGRLDQRIRDRMIAEARGNPRALLAVPRELHPVDLAGGFGLLAGPDVPGHLPAGFSNLPADARELMVLAAAEPLGDVALLLRAATRFRLGPVSDFDACVRFRHPLQRSAVYQAASPEERKQAHRMLAEVTDTTTDPELYAWHRAHSTDKPDDEIAGELERSSRHAGRRGGLAIVAAFLDRAAALTTTPRRRAERAVAAAEAKLLAGAPDAAVRLLASSQTAPPDDLRRAHADTVNADVALTANRRVLAVTTLLDAAARLEPLDPRAARHAYLRALTAAIGAGRLTGEAGLPAIAAAAAAAPPAPGGPGAADLLLDGLLQLTVDPMHAAPIIDKALHALSAEQMPDEERLRWLEPAFVAAMTVWNDDACHAMAEEHVTLARKTGALGVLPAALSRHIIVDLLEGDTAAATAHRAEAERAAAAIGSRVAVADAVLLAAWRGRRDETERLVGAVTDATALTVCDWACAVLYNGLGRHEPARDAAQRACVDPLMPGPAGQWATAELVEAAIRCADRDLASRALAQLTRTTQASRTEWALGIEARSRALLSHGDEAERLYRAAIGRLSSTRLRTEIARSHLVFGEWLRRERRRGDAREHLRTARTMFVAMGSAAFADRAARELLATGEAARQADGPDVLTAQEAQIVTLTREGLTNKEIGRRLYVSPRTVEWHLHNIYAKRGITSRRQLSGVVVLRDQRTC